MEEVKSSISSILISNPYPSTDSELHRNYFHKVGKKIPYRSLGYATLKEFLRSIPDVLAISVSGDKMRLKAIINPKVAHNLKLISNTQRQEDEQNSKKHNLHRYDWPRNNEGSMSISKEPYLSYTNISTDNSTKFSSINDLEQPNISKLNHHAEELSLKLLETLEVTTNDAKQNSKTGYVPAAVQNNFRILIKSFKNGLIYTQLPDAYKFWFNQELDFCKFNYNNLLEMCQDLQNIFFCFVTCGEEIKLFDQSRPLPKDVQKQLKSLKSLAKKKSSSLSQPPSGNHTLNVKHVESMSQSGHMNPPDKKQSTFLSDPAFDLIRTASSSKPATLSQSTSWYKPQPDLSQSTYLHKPEPSISCSTVLIKQSNRRCSSQTSDDEKMEYPANVIKLSEDIPSQYFTIRNPNNKKLSVYVTEVYDPSKFWIILHKNYRGFEELHQKMQLWSNYRKNFKISESFLRLGLYCAALYNNEYYRGRVVKLSLSRHLVKVYFIDIGTVAVINSTELLFLHIDFMKFPQQAIRARLARIQPAHANSPWSENALKYFVNQVSERTVFAQILNINEKSQIVELILQSKTMSNSINNNLVKEGHAVFDHEKQRERPFSNVVPTVNLIHLYPTFSEIEEGIVPNAEEAFRLRKSDHGYDYIYPKYFKKDDLNVSVNKKEIGQSSDKKQIEGELSDPAKCRLRLKKIISSENQLHNEQLISNTSTNLFKPVDSNGSLELPTTVRGSRSINYLNGLSLSPRFESGNSPGSEMLSFPTSQNMPINNWQLNRTPNINYSNNFENFKVKQELESFIFQNLRSGNATSLFYIKRLLLELQPLIYPIQNIYNIVKDEYISLPPHILQIFITMLLNYFDTEKLLELYVLVYHVSSPSTNNQTPIDGTNNKIITTTNFNGYPIYLYHIHNQVYVDMREMLLLTNLNELPLHRISNKTDMANFIKSLLITTLIEHPKLIRELKRYKISFGDKLFLLKVQFMPKFFHIFANEVLPQCSFEKFLKKININRIP